MQTKPVHIIKTISEFHQLRGLPAPAHPLVSVVDYSLIQHTAQHNITSWVLDFYSISIKRNSVAKIKYGQQQYDFDEGVMFFIAPGQVFSVEVNLDAPAQHTGWMLLIHPNFLWNTALAKNIKKYEYFNYAINEALFLSEKEEGVLAEIIKNILQEIDSNIDTFSQNIIIAQIELLLSYSERFYQRQFITRKISNHHILNRLEELLAGYFSNANVAQKGLPTV